MSEGNDERDELGIYAVDPFAFREGESVWADPLEGHHHRAVMLLPVSPLPGPMTEMLTFGGRTVPAALVAAHRTPEGKWGWMHLAPATKTLLVGLLAGKPYSVWYGLVIEDGGSGESVG